MENTKNHYKENCEDLLRDEMKFDNICEILICPECKKKYQLFYDEYWDGEEEYGWFYLEAVE